MRFTFTCLFCFFASLGYSQDSSFIKVHFLYGSKPIPKYKQTEKKWFGGILGGHVGIESDSNQILNFLPSGKFHVFASRRKLHSCYREYSQDDFNSLFGGKTDSVKTTVVRIPVSYRQKQMLDSISATYLKQTPYDYAFFGMRCGAAAYEILAQLNIIKSYSHKTTYLKIFYPKKLRKRLLKLAMEKNWRIERKEGSVKRKWEKD